MFLCRLPAPYRYQSQTTRQHRILSMPDNPDLELGGIPRGGDIVRVGKRFRLTLTFNQSPIQLGSCIDGDSPNDVPQPEALGRTSKPETSFSDGSGAMFSIYLKTAEEEDTKMTDGWKGDADGILVFVRTRGNALLLRLLTWLPVDWFVLGHRRWFPSCGEPGPSTKLSGHFCLLSRSHIPSHSHCKFGCTCPSPSPQPF